MQGDRTTSETTQSEHDGQVKNIDLLLMDPLKDWLGAPLSDFDLVGDR